MATCEVCENEYGKAFEVVVGGKHHTFDSFECAQLLRGIGFQPISHRQDADATAVDAAGLIARYEIEMQI